MNQAAVGTVVWGSKGAFYVVDRDFHVTAYRPLWFGFEYEATSVDLSLVTCHGALLRLRWVDGDPVDDAYYRGRFAGMKRIVGDMIDRGIFDREEAWAYLRRHLLDAVGDPTLLQVRLQE
jgi:hypothetical protein